MPAPRARPAYLAAVAGLAAVALSAGACALVAGPEWAREVGRVDPARNAVQALALASVVRAGTPVEITVSTLGPSSCTRPAGAAVTTSGTVIEIVPYDHVAPPGTGCTRDLRAFPRTAVVRFGASGTVTVRLRARDLAGAPLVLDAAVRADP